MNDETLLERIQTIVDDMKGRDVTLIDLERKSSLAGYMLVVSGTSQRHLMGIAQKIYDTLKHEVTVRIEGGSANTGWVLVDADGVILHLFLPEVRDHYDVESLWQEAFFQKRKMH